MAGSRLGVIHRIALHNFVTYKQVELYPNPHLNMIIGPNGTGKSTFICAIVLGLCGKINIIGRAKKIGEYVKSGCTEAIIEIDLFCDTNGRKVTITRTFNTDNASVWSINRKPAREKEVLDLVKSLNIYVDNLCQLLPQDRVQDFAKMSHRELLKSTQLAIGEEEAINLLEELIDCKLNHRNLTEKFNSNSSQVKENEQINTRLETVLKSMEEIKELKKNISICKKKQLWMEFSKLKKQLTNLKNEQEKASATNELNQKQIAELKKIVSQLDSQYVSLQTKRKTFLDKNIGRRKKQNELLDFSSSFHERIGELKNELEAKIKHQENKQTEIEKAKATLSKYQNDRDNLIKSFGNELNLENEISKIHESMEGTKRNVSVINKKKVEIQYELDNHLVPKIRLHESKLMTLKNAGNKRLEMIRSFNSHTYEAVLWLRDNLHLFKKKVYEPMVLELNFHDLNHAKYLENTVSNRDLLAFTFEDISDMNLFMKTVRIDKGLKLVSAVHSEPSRQSFTPIVPMDNLKQFGFYAYLVDMIHGPKPIIDFLCKLYSIHRIPVGNDLTYKLSLKVPQEVRFFYTSNHRFTIKISRYSGQKSTSTSEIRNARLFTDTTDHKMIREVENLLTECLSLRQTKSQDVENLNIEISRHEDHLHKSISRRQELREHLDKLKTISSRVRLQEKDIVKMQNEPRFNVDEGKKKFQMSVENFIKQQHTSQKNISSNLKEICEDSIAAELLKIKLKSFYNLTLEKSRELTNIKGASSALSIKLSSLKEEVQSVTYVLEEKRTEAKSSTNNLSPESKSFPYKNEFKELPSDLDALQEHLATLQTKLDCMDTGDEQMIVDYKTRKHKIKNLNNEITDIKKKLEQLEGKMTMLKDKWLPPLENHISKINKQFGDTFSKVGFAGEVKISKEGNDEDYDKYGIVIMVRFREEENLQPLTHFTQSGGERALATSLYLMSLQQLSKAPFRCVDEINQGMDKVNERKMLELLIKITTENENMSQYFVLTPKLLYDLKYSSLIKVHTIMNGPRSIKYSKWNIKKFIDQAKKGQK